MATFTTKINDSQTVQVTGGTSSTSYNTIIDYQIASADHLGVVKVPAKGGLKIDKQGNLEIDGEVSVSIEGGYGIEVDPGDKNLSFVINAKHAKVDINEPKPSNADDLAQAQSTYDSIQLLNQGIQDNAKIIQDHTATFEKISNLITQATSSNSQLKYIISQTYGGINVKQLTNTSDISHDSITDSYTTRYFRKCYIDSNRIIYSDITIPEASKNRLGGIKIKNSGDSEVSDSDSIVLNNQQLQLRPATFSRLGGVRIDNSTIKWDSDTYNYIYVDTSGLAQSIFSKSNNYITWDNDNGKLVIVGHNVDLQFTSFTVGKLTGLFDSGYKITVTTDTISVNNKGHITAVSEDSTNNNIVIPYASRTNSGLMTTDNFIALSNACPISRRASYQQAGLMQVGTGLTVDSSGVVSAKELVYTEGKLSLNALPSQLTQKINLTDFDTDLRNYIAIYFYPSTSAATSDSIITQTAAGDYDISTQTTDDLADGDTPELIATWLSNLDNLYSFQVDLDIERAITVFNEYIRTSSSATEVTENDVIASTTGDADDTDSDESQNGNAEQVETTETPAAQTTDTTSGSTASTTTSGTSQAITSETTLDGLSSNGVQNLKLLQFIRNMQQAWGSINRIYLYRATDDNDTSNAADGLYMACYGRPITVPLFFKIRVAYYIDPYSSGNPAKLDQVVLK